MSIIKYSIEWLVAVFEDIKPTDENKSLNLGFVKIYFVVKVQTLYHNREAKKLKKRNLEKMI
jgi:hypothetical protein